VSADAAFVPVSANHCFLLKNENIKKPSKVFTDK
jgi:hypothetical protein